MMMKKSITSVPLDSRMLVDISLPTMVPNT